MSDNVVELQAVQVPINCSCGHWDKTVRHMKLVGLDAYYVCCMGCHKTGPSQHTREEAIHAWNRVMKPTPEANYWELVQEMLRSRQSVLVTMSADGNPLLHLVPREDLVIHAFPQWHTQKHHLTDDERTALAKTCALHNIGGLNYTVEKIIEGMLQDGTIRP